MWRPLVDVRDVADAMVAAMEAPAELVRGEMFNVRAFQLPDPRAGHARGRVGAAAGPRSAPHEAPAPKLTRDYECSNHKLSQRLGFTPCRSVVEAVSEMLEAIDVNDRRCSPIRVATTSAGWS